MGYTRTNHRLIHGETHQVSFQQTLSELVDLMGAEAVQEYLAKYPANMKQHVAEIKLRILKATKEATNG
jgi:hypothetical protein